MTNRYYSPAEETFILENYHKQLTCQAIADALGRTVDAIQHKAMMMGLTSKGWTEEQKKYLADNYEKADMTAMMKHLDKKAKAISAKAFRMGLHRDLSVNNFRSGRSYNGTKRNERPAPIKTIQPKVIQVLGHVNKPAKPRSKTFATIPFSLDGKMWLHIDRRTHICVPADASPEQLQKIISRYKKTA